MIRPRAESAYVVQRGLAIIEMIMGAEHVRAVQQENTRDAWAIFAASVVEMRLPVVTITALDLHKISQRVDVDASIEHQL